MLILEHEFNFNSIVFYWPALKLIQLIGISGLPQWFNDKESTYSAGDPGLITGSARSPGGGNGNPLRYSCLENSMERGAWWVTVHGVAKSWTRLSDSAQHIGWQKGSWEENANGLKQRCLFNQRRNSPQFTFIQSSPFSQPLMSYPSTDSSYTSISISLAIDFSPPWLSFSPHPVGIFMAGQLVAISAMHSFPSAHCFLRGFLFNSFILFHFPQHFPPSSKISSTKI